MDNLRFRPTLQQLEDRTTPTDMSFAVSYLGRMSEDMGWMAHPSARAWAQNYFTGLYQEVTAAAPTADSQFVASFANSIGGWLGFNVVPPPIPVTPPTPPSPDAGMVDTMPDINAPEWVLQQNGLKTWDVVVGSGDPVLAGDSITIFYTGWLASNGLKFDDARSPGAPANFALGNLIQGWQQGIPGMQPGGIRRLYIPSALGYGSAGSPSSNPPIPPDADLVFEIKMVSHT